MTIQRRTFLKSSASFLPAMALQKVLAQSSPEAPAAPALHPVPAGEDRSGHLHSLGFSSLAFKVVPSDTAATSSSLSTEISYPTRARLCICISLRKNGST